ncbi:MAG TPA: septum formation initiator family protein [Methylocystis sp.]|nr:septum formation initiator family protein [Methylocystis sp.]
MYRLQLMLRAFFVSLGLYGPAGLVIAYFLWQGVNGQRGLKAGEEYEQQLTRLRYELLLAKNERLQWERRISLMRGEEIDSDVLDEEAHALLGRVQKNEVVVLTGGRQ